MNMYASSNDNDTVDVILDGHCMTIPKSLANGMAMCQHLDTKRDEVYSIVEADPDLVNLYRNDVFFQRVCDTMSLPGAIDLPDIVKGIAALCKINTEQSAKLDQYICKYGRI